ncbi:MAG: type II secretion system protein GspG [SAR324 cluster bacterium]|nr:type II secretion system protein GspG [SAR324 cluster bacterium]
MKPQKSYQGFSLVETIIALAVLSLMIAGVLPLAGSYLEKAKFSKAQSEVETIIESIHNFREDTKRYPVYTAAAGTKLDFLESDGNDPAGKWAEANFTNLSNYLIDDPTTKNYQDSAGAIDFSPTDLIQWNGPYLEEKSNFSDPWGQKYLIGVQGFYDSTDTQVWVLSAGSDMTLDTTIASTMMGADIGKRMQ